MEILACGLNAHGQLILRNDHTNITTFQKMAKGHRVVVLSACWCATLLCIDGQLHYRGYYEARPSDYHVTCPEGTIVSAFGDHQGIHGALTAEGSLLELVRHSPRSDALLFQNPSQSWTRANGCSLEHVALAANGQIAVVARTSGPPLLKPASRLYMFSTLVELKASAPSGFPGITATLPLITFLVSTAVSFVALTDDGTVLSWGSALHPQLLGRHPAADVPAEFPHPVPFLEGIPIRKIAACGWICLAISRDDDLYMWGGPPGNDAFGRIDGLPDWQAGEDVKLVDIDGGSDIIDAGVGDGHVIALTEKGEVWVAGQGQEGQLGSHPVNEAFQHKWTRSSGLDHQKVLKVDASGWNSFLTVKENQN